MFSWKDQRVIVTGGAGFLGRNVVAALRARGVPEASVFVARSRDHDLTDPAGARRMLGEAFPRTTVIVHCAGFIGGLGANRAYPARMFHDNLAMGLNVVEAARASGLIDRGGRVLVVGSMCSYPADAPVPYREESLFGGLPDAEVAPYGIAKLALLQMLGAYRAQYGLRCAYVIPTGLFGPGTEINPDRTHVVGALVRRYVEAAEQGVASVVNWGSGSAVRDLLYVDDAAAGLVRAMEELEEPTPINLTGGVETPIRALAETIARLSGYRGETVWDTSKGDGQPRRSLDGSRALRLLGWKPTVGLEEGVRRTIAWYQGVRQQGVS